jgi:hypothetical protein
MHDGRCTRANAVHCVRAEWWCEVKAYTVADRIEAAEKTWRTLAGPLSVGEKKRRRAITVYPRERVPRIMAYADLWLSCPAKSHRPIFTLDGFLWIMVRTPNPLNGSHGSHFASAAKRIAPKAAGVIAATVLLNAAPSLASGFSKIEVCRSVRGSGLDAHDNLPAALKPFVDGVALAFCRADNHVSLEWFYSQRTNVDEGHWVGLRLGRQ